MWAARSAGVVCVPKRTAAHLAVSKSGFLLTADLWKTGLVSESGFLLTAGPWKLGSVSKSTLLLTAGLWEIGSVSKLGFLLTASPWEIELLSEGMWILAAGGLEMIKMSYICIYADIFDIYTCDGRQCDRPNGFEFQDRKIL